jgi:NAD(P)-dependent dehydrogenase (short-subunit alcohol dehydrogenase family)
MHLHLCYLCYVVLQTTYQRVLILNNVHGKVAIVTGGGSGIGEATAILLSAAGADLVVTDINRTTGEETVETIKDQGGRAIFVAHDVTQESGWQLVCQATLAEFGRLDILVNNAGITGADLPPFEEATLASWHAVMRINLDAVFLGTQQAVLMMKDTGGGSIINLSSVMGLVGGASAAYNASKGGVCLLTKSVAVHCGKMGYNIRVNSVHPGYIWTPMISSLVDVIDEGNMTEEGLREMLTEQHPIGRLGVAEDIAKGILFLASDDSSFMTGSELVIDGGYTAV